MGADLNLRQVRQIRGGREILQVDDLDVCDGEHVSVLGPNGAGKTTLLRLLAGVDRPATGTVTLDGVSTGRGGVELRRQVAYATQQQESPTWPPRAYPSPSDVLARAEQLGSPPVAWARLLAVRPDLLADWTHLYWSTVHGGVLDPRLGQLVRVYMSRRLGCPEWAPADSSAVREAGLSANDVDALSRNDTAWLAPKERAALAYADEVITDSDVPDSVFARVAAELSEAEIVQLGFAVAVQNGAIRAFRSLREDPDRSALLASALGDDADLEDLLGAADAAMARRAIHEHHLRRLRAHLGRPGRKGAGKQAPAQLIELPFIYRSSLSIDDLRGLGEILEGSGREAAGGA